MHGREQALGDWGLGEGQQASLRPEGDEERCDSGSNLRMDSISSPKSSIRTGRSISGE